ncbi:aldo/keto reductase [Sphingomonas sp. LY54]|uniref:aldo/keto reductase n=1 Tax=Sphingomonas sp. LY54 TaxID=3095343 RepID=UPI002D7971FA|nr:aldo/keto reductase [Sphingomonas sp. LY54]WRP29869.1 aldo/keto reductase [Sphingomonas sp. LY54]
MVAMRQLGDSGLMTPPLVLGGNVFGWTADRERSFEILDRFVARGGTMIDTADVYSSWVPGNQGGETETIIGEWLKRRGRRDDVLIATKVGHDKGLSADWIAQAVDRSLARLGTDYIDLYYSHKDDTAVPLEETLGAFDRLVKAGKVRVLGASQIEADRLGEALDISAREGLAAYSVLQTWYNLVERSRYEGALADLVAERGLGMVAFYGLASGFLTGKYRGAADLGKSPRGGGMEKYLDARGLRVLAALDEVAGDLSATPAQVALAWLAAQPAVTAPIASATSLDQLDDLLGAVELQLSPGHRDLLNAASRED